MPTTYLYIPFKSNEDPSELANSAKKWKKVFEDKQLLKEALADDTDEPYLAKGIVICYAGEKKLQNVQEGDSVYILAHGMQDTNDVCNKMWNADSVLNQETVAERLLEEDIPNVAFKLKLYYCDESNNADKRMEEFHKVFEKSNLNKVQTFFYPGVILSTPSMPVGVFDPLKSHKRAYVKLNLLELERNQLKKYLSDQIAKMDPETLKAFILSLGYKVIMQLIQKSDPATLKLMCEKAQITNVHQFLNNLKEEKPYTESIMIELGVAKDFKKEHPSKGGKMK
jgi:hypothetical protein